MTHARSKKYTLTAIQRSQAFRQHIFFILTQWPALTHIQKMKDLKKSDELKKDSAKRCSGSNECYGTVASIVPSTKLYTRNKQGSYRSWTLLSLNARRGWKWVFVCVWEFTSRTHNKSIAQQAKEPNHLTEYRLSAYAIHFFFFSSLILILSTNSDSFSYLSHFWFNFSSPHNTCFLSISLFDSRIHTLTLFFRTVSFSHCYLFYSLSLLSTACLWLCSLFFLTF